MELSQDAGQRCCQCQGTILLVFRGWQCCIMSGDQGCHHQLVPQAGLGGIERIISSLEASALLAPALSAAAEGG